MPTVLPLAFDIPPWLPPEMALPALVGSGLALGLIVMFIAIRVLRRPQRHPLLPPEVKEDEFDPFVMGSASEKRKIFRRRGNHVRVLIRAPGCGAEPIAGVVLDRSSGGLAISVPNEFPNGTHLHVRPESDTEGFWLELEVRSARQKHGEWHLGCKFVENPPWSLLLQFG